MSDENNLDEKKKLDKKNMSDYEHISDLTTIGGQEKKSFDSVVNWTLMVNLAGFGFLVSKMLSMEPFDLRTVSILLWTISILFFFTVAFAVRGWRSYKAYYKYSRARRDKLGELKEGKNSFQISELDTRGRSHKDPCFWEFLASTEFVYLVICQCVLYLVIVYPSQLLNPNRLCPVIIGLLACALYVSINYIVYRRHNPKDCG